MNKKYYPELKQRDILNYKFKFQMTQFIWRDTNYSIKPRRGDEIKILQNISGSISGGNLVAILGTC